MSTGSIGTCRLTKRGRGSPPAEPSTRPCRGNLDPAVLLGPVERIGRQAASVIRRGAGRGHIFNLGHGIYPDTPIENVEALVHAVRLNSFNPCWPLLRSTWEARIRRRRWSRFCATCFADPDIIQLRWARPLQPILARFIARRRAAFSRAAYAQIGGRSPIREESTAQVQAVVAAMAASGVVAKPYLAMSYWHPFPAETAAAMQADGITRALLLPLYPHRSRTTSGSAFRTIESALKRAPIATARIEGYATNPGYLDALCDRIAEATGQLPESERATAPVLFSAHGLPEEYVRRGDSYLDDIRATVAAVHAAAGVGGSGATRLSKPRGPAALAGAHHGSSTRCPGWRGQRAVVVVPVSFTGEHVETLQEIDILYRERARRAGGLTSFARARAVSCHPAFIAGLAGLLVSAAHDRGWV